MTAGIGHKLTKEEIKKYPEGTEVEESVVNQWFTEDLKVASEGAESLVPNAPPEVKNILTNMVFNMGLRGVKGFKKMLKAIEQENYTEAAKEMKDSKWFSQVGNRSKRLIKRMESLGNNDG